MLNVVLYFWPKSDADDRIQTLIKIAGNILENPDQAKFRELRAMNGTIKNRILDIQGGHEYLIAVCLSLLMSIFLHLYTYTPRLRVYTLSSRYAVLPHDLSTLLHVLQVVLQLPPKCGAQVWGLGLDHP